MIKINCQAADRVAVLRFLIMQRARVVEERQSLDAAGFDIFASGIDSKAAIDGLRDLCQSGFSVIHELPPTRAMGGGAALER